MSDVQSLVNIGVRTAEKLNKIGIDSAEEFLKKDPYVVFAEIQKKVDPGFCRCALACLVGAHVGIPWYKITKKSAAEYEKRHPDYKWGKC